VAYKGNDKRERDQQFHERGGLFNSRLSPGAWLRPAPSARAA
jgi:hypothetical protein